MLFILGTWLKVSLFTCKHSVVEHEILKTLPLSSAAKNCVEALPRDLVGPCIIPCVNCNPHCCDWSICMIKRCFQPHAWIRKECLLFLIELMVGPEAQIANQPFLIFSYRNTHLLSQNRDSETHSSLGAGTKIEAPSASKSPTSKALLILLPLSCEASHSATSSQATLSFPDHHLSIKCDSLF